MVINTFGIVIIIAAAIIIVDAIIKVNAIIIFLSIIELYYMSLEVSIEPTLFHAGCRHSPHPGLYHIYEQAIA